MSAILVAQNLHKSYWMGDIEVNALQGVDLSVQKGEFIAIMGPSGSGKSTLLHILGGLDRPSEGEVRLEGTSLKNLFDSKLAEIRRRRVGFVFQFFNLIPTLTAAENVYLPLLLDNKKSREFDDVVHQVLSQVGLRDRSHHLPSQLSGGEQQRVAIARALVIQPGIVLADEPTGNLDSSSSIQILELLRSISDQHNKTIIMVTHDRQAASYADKVRELQDGIFIGSEE